MLVEGVFFQEKAGYMESRAEQKTPRSVLALMANSGPFRAEQKTPTRGLDV